MSAAEVLVLLRAGLGAGFVGSAAGLASLISYPALLAVGLPPLAANVTNTVALVFSGVGAALGSREELRGQRLRLRRLGVAAVLGGGVGGALLLLTPPGAFARIVPWLIGFASLAILLPRRPPVPDHLRHGSERWLPVGVFVVAVYGGYFGAAAGVLILALVLAVTGESLARGNAVKNVVLGVANAVAALGFVVLGPVHWAAAVPLAAGFFAGARVGPAVVRHAPDRLVRVVIAVAGTALAVKLWIDAYG